MAHILYEQGKKIGEVTDWNLTKSQPVYKEVLGKKVLLPAKNDLCTFNTPKPVNRKAQLTILEDQKWELVLEIKSVKVMVVTAYVTERNKL